MSRKIFDWAASRSGDAITVTGLDETGDKVRVSNVMVIAGGPDRVTAYTKTYESFDLVGGLPL